MTYRTAKCNRCGGETEHSFAISGGGLVQVFALLSAVDRLGPNLRPGWITARLRNGHNLDRKIGSESILATKSLNEHAGVEAAAIKLQLQLVDCQHT